jgi:SAM-dependent methyltransferase
MATENAIEFIEDDVVGQKTQEVISNADKFNLWMFDTIRPFLKGRVLEIGSGIGNISEFLLQEGFDSQLSDIREGYCRMLRQKFAGHPRLLGVEPIDLVDPDFEASYPQHVGSYDTAFALNVIEHIQDDVLALKNCHRMLKSGGRMIALVPSYQPLYNRFDTLLGHYRRYNTGTFSKAFLEAGFEVEHKQYFNFVGIFGWFLSGNILRKDTIPEGQMKLYNQLVPMIRVIDSLVMHSMGLSTIVVGRKR